MRHSRPTSPSLPLRRWAFHSLLRPLLSTWLCRRLLVLLHIPHRWKSSRCSGCRPQRRFRGVLRQSLLHRRVPTRRLFSPRQSLPLLAGRDPAIGLVLAHRSVHRFARSHPSAGGPHRTSMSPRHHDRRRATRITSSGPRMRSSFSGATASTSACARWRRLRPPTSPLPHQASRSRSAHGRRT
jgi:hypothetical protein